MLTARWPYVSYRLPYMVDGRQYIVVAVSGGAYSGEYLAFSLPESEIKRTSQEGR